MAQPVASVKQRLARKLGPPLRLLTLAALWMRLLTPLVISITVLLISSFFSSTEGCRGSCRSAPRSVPALAKWTRALFLL